MLWHQHSTRRRRPNFIHRIVIKLFIHRPLQSDMMYVCMKYDHWHLSHGGRVVQGRVLLELLDGFPLHFDIWSQEDESYCCWCSSDFTSSANDFCSVVKYLKKPLDGLLQNCNPILPNSVSFFSQSLCFSF